SGYDSMNPFVAYSSQSYDAFIEQYPTLVQYKQAGPEQLQIEGDWAKSWKTSKDGKTWTFDVRVGQWSDRKPPTAQDGVRTGNPTRKYKAGATASLAPFISHAVSFSAPNDHTLVIKYDKPVGNVLPNLQQFYILPRQVWEAQIGTNGK